MTVLRHPLTNFVNFLGEFPKHTKRQKKLLDLSGCSVFDTCTQHWKQNCFTPTYMGLRHLCKLRADCMENDCIEKWMESSSTNGDQCWHHRRSSVSPGSFHCHRWWEMEAMYELTPTGKLAKTLSITDIFYSALTPFNSLTTMKWGAVSTALKHLPSICRNIAAKEWKPPFSNFPLPQKIKAHSNTE